MNRVVLFGRLGRDPQLRVKAPVAHFPLAVSEPYTDTATGERIERVTWFHIQAWNRLSEITSQYLKKGDQALVEGRIQLREFEGRDGTKRAMLLVTANRIEFGAKAVRDAGAEACGGAAEEVRDDESEADDFSDEDAEPSNPEAHAADASSESFLTDDDIPW